jgi:hypothetical protein
MQAHAEDIAGNRGRKGIALDRLRQGGSSFASQLNEGMMALKKRLSKRSGRWRDAPSMSRTSCILSAYSVHTQCILSAYSVHTPYTLYTLWYSCMSTLAAVGAYWPLKPLNPSIGLLGHFLFHWVMGNLLSISRLRLTHPAYDV